VARFLIAAETGTLLGDAARREMLTPPRGSDGEPLPYAHGWFVQTLDDGRPVHWHYGYLPGSHSALFVVLPESGDALVLLAASDGLSAPFWLHEGDVTRSPFARAFLEDRSPGR
jgi:CubicO group peptidase (beta-lactamase class C family)